MPRHKNKQTPSQKDPSQKIASVAKQGKSESRRRTRRNIAAGVAHINATFNNTTVTITDTKGDALCWASAGTSGFKGSRKSTPFAGQCAAQQAAEKALDAAVLRHGDAKAGGAAVLFELRTGGGIAVDPFAVETPPTLVELADVTAGVPVDPLALHLDPSATEVPDDLLGELLGLVRQIQADVRRLRAEVRGLRGDVDRAPVADPWGRRSSGTR